MNGVVTLFTDPSEWEMKQFVTMEQLEAFAEEHQLAVIWPLKEQEE